MSQLISCCFAFAIFSSLVTLIQSSELTCSGVSHVTKATAYTSAPDQGGSLDCKGAKSNSLQDFLANRVPYVSVALDRNLWIDYGTEVCILELNEHYGRDIIFKVVDTADSFDGAGFSRINICVSSLSDASDPLVNGELIISFPLLRTGVNYCT